MQDTAESAVCIETCVVQKARKVEQSAEHKRVCIVAIPRATCNAVQVDSDYLATMRVLASKPLMTCRM
jgi:deoxyribose-phosphate aldolase